MRCRERARVDGAVAGVEPGQVGPAGQVGVEGGALDERADPGQDVAAPPPASAARAASSSPAVGAIRPEQHPDGRRLARSVRPEEAEDGAVRHEQVDVVDRDLPAPEPLGEAPGGQGGRVTCRIPDRGRGRRRRGVRQLGVGRHGVVLFGVVLFAAACSSTAGSTAPT